VLERSERKKQLSEDKAIDGDKIKLFVPIERIKRRSVTSIIRRVVSFDLITYTNTCPAG
jgi:hypothetical protein